MLLKLGSISIYIYIYIYNSEVFLGSRMEAHDMLGCSEIEHSAIVKKK